MTFVERYGPWALVTGASAPSNELSFGTRPLARSSGILYCPPWQQ